MRNYKGIARFTVIGLAALLGGCGDGCDPPVDLPAAGTPGDIDGDGVRDGVDKDIDGDGIPNSEDDDVDGDGIANADDPTPYGDAADQTGAQGDIDGDGIPNGIDDDDNGDGVPDGVVGVGSCDGVTPAADEASDCDGYCIAVESGFVPCDDGAPPGSGQPDTDGDGVPDISDPDDDGDGIPDGADDDNTGLDPGTPVANEGEGEGDDNGDCNTAELPVGCDLFADCEVAYPYDSAFPATSVDFNESDVLQAMTVIGSGAAQQVRVFYGDEHALTLGVRHVSVASPASETDYPVTPMPAGQVAGAAADPDVGATALTGDQAGTDPDGRPVFPSLFITDITDDPLLCTEGHEAGCNDWQFGGTPVPPHDVFGTWKAGTRSVDGSSVSTDNDDDPPRNNDDLGAGDVAPSGIGHEGFSAEVRWDVSRLGLVHGHTYRLYVMVHDGDHSADVGQGCGVATF